MCFNSSAALTMFNDNADQSIFRACRRARLKDKAIHAINKTGAAAGSVSRDLTNRVHGLAAQVGSVFKSGDADDDTLAARVRSRMGRAVSHR